jgi:hypothetical protein
MAENNAKVPNPSQQQQNDQQQQQQQQPPQQPQQQQPQPLLVALVQPPVNNVPIVQAQVVQGADGGMAVRFSKPICRSSGDRRIRTPSRPMNLSNGWTK